MSSDRTGISQTDAGFSPSDAGLLQAAAPQAEFSDGSRKRCRKEESNTNSEQVREEFYH